MYISIGLHTYCIRLNNNRLMSFPRAKAVCTFVNLAYNYDW